MSLYSVDRETPRKVHVSLMEKATRPESTETRFQTLTSLSKSDPNCRDTASWVTLGRWTHYSVGLGPSFLCSLMLSNREGERECVEGLSSVRVVGPRPYL